jgi:hypothetical protein
MKQDRSCRSQIEKLGRQLGMTPEQISSILYNTYRTTEHHSFSLGPPMYCGALYGTISTIVFNNRKK